MTASLEDPWLCAFIHGRPNDCPKHSQALDNHALLPLLVLVPIIESESELHIASPSSIRRMAYAAPVSIRFDCCVSRKCLIPSMVLSTSQMCPMTGGGFLAGVHLGQAPVLHEEQQMQSQTSHMRTWASNAAYEQREAFHRWLLSSNLSMQR